jgi:hypothetical protein
MRPCNRLLPLLGVVLALANHGSARDLSPADPMALTLPLHGNKVSVCVFPTDGDAEQIMVLFEATGKIIRPGEVLLTARDEHGRPIRVVPLRNDAGVYWRSEKALHTYFGNYQMLCGDRDVTNVVIRWKGEKAEFKVPEPPVRPKARLCRAER